MIKLEIKKNIGGLIGWNLVLVIMFLLVFIMFPSIVKDSEAMMQVLNTMDQTLLEMFNLDTIHFDSVFSWIATEGHVFLLLIGGIYFAILGGTILLKEESEGTIEFLYSKNITRNKIFLNKMLIGIIFAIIFNVIILVFLAIGLFISDDLKIKELLLLMLTSFLAHLSFFSISLFISTFMKKTSKATMLALAIVFIFYMINILYIMEDMFDALKYLTPFYYTNARTIIQDGTIDINNILILLISIIVINIIALIKYNKKELS